MDTTLIGIAVRDTYLSSDRSIPCYGVPKTYSDAIVAAGGTPLLLPPSPQIFTPKFFHMLSGLMLIGGEDVDPTHYKELPHEKLGRTVSWRDEQELTALKLADQLKMPVLGICRGCQIMNVHRGGSLIQHLEHHPDTAFTPELPEDFAFAALDPKSKLARTIGEQRIATNSLHHQAIKDVGRELKVVAHSVQTDAQRDIAVEAIEDIDESRFFCGVQWHPEWIPGEESSKRLFLAFVEAAESYAKGKR